MNIKINLFKIINSAFLKSSALLLILVFSAFALPQNVFAVVAKTSASTNTEDENFDKKFREGRDLIDKQDWKKAADKFNEVINQYPANKSVDAALYWLAFCYKKQREFEKVGATVDRLVKDYPSSSWTSDARILLIEVAQPATVVYGTAGQDTSVFTGQGGVTIANTYPALNSLKPGQPLTITSVANGSDAYAVMSGFYASETKTPLDREDEIKIAAFQSLLSADSKKGVEAMSDILKPDSKSSETLQIEVLRVVRRSNFKFTSSVNRTLSTSLAMDAAGSPAAPLVKEALMKSLRNTLNPKIRTETIYTLASLKDEQTINYLSELYNSEGNQEVKKAIINGLGSSWGFGGFYTFSSSTINAAIVNPTRNGFGQPLNVTTEKADADKKPEFVKLLEIVKTEKNSELRRLALTNVQRFAGWQRNAQMVDVLSRIYDSETDETFKKSLIQSLARFDQPQAARKLLEIAKTDKSDKLKLEAIYALGKSKDPAAVNYLQQVLQ